VTIRRQLLIYLLGGMFAATLVATLATYIEVRNETNELFDYQLQQIADALPNEIPIGLNLPVGKVEHEEIEVQVWDADGRLVFTSGPMAYMPRFKGFGLRSISYDGKGWRIFSEGNANRFIQISQPHAVRNELAAGMALRTLTPFMILIPILALLIWLVVGRGLAPIHLLAHEVSQRSPDALDPLPDHAYPPELQPILRELNALLDQLARAFATQRAFVADAAHELRTPLAALKLQLQLVEREQDRTEIEAGFRKLHDRLNRATHLVQQLLTLARHEHHTTRPQHRVIDLQELAISTVSDHAPQAENKGVDLGVMPFAGALAPRILGDESSLRIMLGNLIDNATRYTQVGGRVDVAIGLAEDGAPILRVADNGPGIPEEDRERVFDRFYRREGTGQSGSGLGLFIARTIADQHEARIELSRTAERGLTVTVRFKPAPSASSASANGAGTLQAVLRPFA
jgi:two-component system OmpR family sensor kinase